ncbi:hypothetical protein SOVF_080320 [Spinacia oleracea]|nr:hypothetical protein SOVF_080320 [Spinacia oleracea]
MAEKPATSNFVEGTKNAAQKVETAVTTQTEKISKSAGEMSEKTKNSVGDALNKAGEFVKPAPPPPEESLMDKAKGLFK